MNPISFIAILFLLVLGASDILPGNDTATPTAHEGTTTEKHHEH